MKYKPGEILLIVGDEDENDWSDNRLGMHHQVGELCQIFRSYFSTKKSDIYYMVLLQNNEGKFDENLVYYVWHRHLKPQFTDEELNQKALEMLG